MFVGAGAYRTTTPTPTHLQRSSCEQEAVSGLVRRAKRLRELALSVLHPVALVDDDVLPHRLLQRGLVLMNQAILDENRHRRDRAHTSRQNR